MELTDGRAVMQTGNGQPPGVKYKTGNWQPPGAKYK